jgi:small-conductance mechanosensitive channel
LFEFSLLDRLLEQIDIVLLVLDRPVVQRQLLVLALLILAAELVAWRLIDLRSNFFAVQDEAERRPVEGNRPYRQIWVDWLANNRTLRRWLRALEHTYSPIVAILLGQLAISAFEQSGWRTGLLRQVLFFFWLLLAFRLIVTLLYAWQSERIAQIYHKRFLLPSFWLLLIFTITRALSGIIDLVGIRLFSFSENHITLGSLYLATVVIYTFILLSWLVQGLLSQFILPRFGTDLGLSNSIYTVSRYIVISAGILATLASLGIDLTSLAIIGAGLSVGIGFGLQELVANFISGILLLFEQSIRPGDIVEVEGKMGTVEKLRIRSTTVRTFDNVEVIIPNQSLLTSSVTTYTHTNRRIRLRISAGASYNDDPQEVREALLAAVDRHGLVLKEPAPLVFFTGYGESSIDFEIMAWVEDIANMMKVRSDLHFMIWREFEKRQIEIPFPQRDLHLRSGIPWENMFQLRQGENSSESSEPTLEDEEPINPLKRLDELSKSSANRM